MFEVVIRGDLVLPDRVQDGGWLAVAGGSIAALGVGDPPDSARLIDARGKFVFPGVIDGQVHAGSFAGVAGLADATVAAAAGGVTTIVDMPFDDPAPANSVDMLQQKIEAIGRLATVDVALYAAPRKGAGTEGIAEMAEAGACAFKVSTYEYHPVRFPRFDTGELIELFPAIRDTGLPVSFHNEDPYLVDRLTAQLKASGRTGPESHAASRPPLAELVANVAVFEIARWTGVRCHIVHSTLARGFDHVRHYRAEGAQVSAETCVQYLVFEDTDVLRQGARLKQNPPIRPAAERAALWAKVVAGEVDFVSSDHVAWPLSRKADPDMFKNGAGVPGLETLLPALWTGMVRDRGLSPTRVARLLSEGPARHFGLWPRKGSLSPGADADFAILSPEERTFDASRMASEVKWSPYGGMSFGVQVDSTWLAGMPVFEVGRVVSGPRRGRFVRPG